MNEVTVSYGSVVLQVGPVLCDLRAATVSTSYVCTRLPSKYSQYLLSSLSVCTVGMYVAGAAS